jgi:hypothetical protein
VKAVAMMAIADTVVVIIADVLLSVPKRNLIIKNTA